ncbi:MAG: invasion associated locus B family protein [Hyphomicrobiales bacterium]|nr:invasion associated locus B family protein [Hyphomicrobiales bacterium]MCY4048722.1 invasion associated locus B family protein [Hyphomicrobiales bacterium]MCY4053365.1 invasion associated locus B family protein [Hyphomicrobiales bacterium]
MYKIRLLPILFFALAVFGSSIAIGDAFAQSANTPELIEVHRDWSVYHYGTGANEICYVFSKPKSQRPKGLNRGRVFFTVTHRADGTRNEVSLRAGYKFSAKSKPFAKIDNKEFSFYTGVQEGDERAHWAWMHSQDDEASLVRSMKNGSQMVIKGTSSRGTITTDTYSLLGVTKALEAIDKRCQ